MNRWAEGRIDIMQMDDVGPELGKNRLDRALLPKRERHPRRGSQARRELVVMPSHQLDFVIALKKAELLLYVAVLSARSAVETVRYKDPQNGSDLWVVLR